ncbi:TetR/AcrR family transcriptional regulator [Mycobacteroides abscessus]|uniref:TetR/AcrR family transcriptional regulator n=1 Tax=Mycobacteroides abscessus TaxID=36809 RepID=UPI000C26BABB|nr:TetR/AcrR family transcriptional regulator [Mycobacteroides abscessus]
MTEDLVNAALQAAHALGKDVADVPLVEVARAAGVSRSTLLRRLGGTRQALDAAVRETGVDPGGRAPVRERATVAAAELIDERGLAAVTLEAVATQADCSVHSLYAAFGGRDELLRATFDRFGPIVDIEDTVGDSSVGIEEKLHRIYQRLVQAFSQKPRVMPAMYAEIMARPFDPSVRKLIEHNAPRMLGSVGLWLSGEIAAGRIRDLPVTVLTQQLLAPVVMHTALRPAAEGVLGLELPDIQEVCKIFADAFLHGVRVPEPPRG